MAFWNSHESAPMRNYRWQVTIGGFKITGVSDTDVVWWAKTVSVPSWDMNEVEHDYFDNKFYFPGRVTWQDVELTLVDPVSPSAVEITNRILQGSGYEIAKQPGAKKTLAKSKAANPGGAGMKSFKLELYDAEGTVKETWTLNNAFIKAAKYGDMDYANDDLRQISLTIKYDWASCTIGSNPEQFGKGSN
tara:strand:- start:105 stop:674 length:570 start_codon:yes stop_codon:yes gene_type:complete